MTAFPSNFRHVANQIYAGGAPDANFLSFFKNTLGGRTVLSLDDTVGRNISNTTKNLKLAHVVVALNASDPSMTDNLKKLISMVRGGFIDSAQPIYIHCLHGSDRTGLAVALYRVMRQGWSCGQAVAEATQYGYGQGIAPQTQQLWKSILCNKGAVGTVTKDTNSIDDDIVQTMRDDFAMGDVAPAFNPQQSFAPFIDLRNQPSAQSASDRERSRDLRRNILDQISQDINDNSIPMVGDYNNYGPMGGAGVVENSGILQLI